MFKVSCYVSCIGHERQYLYEMLASLWPFNTYFLFLCAFRGQDISRTTEYRGHFLKFGFFQASWGNNFKTTCSAKCKNRNTVILVQDVLKTGRGLLLKCAGKKSYCSFKFNIKFWVMWFYKALFSLFKCFKNTIWVISRLEPQSFTVCLHT